MSVNRGKYKTEVLAENLFWFCNLIQLICVLAEIGFVFENRVWVSTHYEFMGGTVIVHGIS
jgi:hypothetical protein